MNGSEDNVRPFPHRAYERLAEHCGGVVDGRAQEGPPARRGPAGNSPRWHPSQGRPDICPRCDARWPCCYCHAEVADLRLFARRMAELHQPTGTPVCGCGAHHCYVRKRLDQIPRGARP